MRGKLFRIAYVRGNNHDIEGTAPVAEEFGCVSYAFCWKSFVTSLVQQLSQPEYEPQIGIYY